MAVVNGINNWNVRWLRRGFGCCAVVAVLLAAGGALAQPRQALTQFDSESPIKAFAAQRGGVSLGQATSMARGRYPGRVVRAETVMMGDRVVHEIRILGDDGRVRTVRVDAQTGAFM